MKMPSDIRREDEQTFWVRKSKRQYEEYMVYQDDDGRWLCDCTDFWIHLPDQGKTVTHKCKHILRCMLLI